MKLSVIIVNYNVKHFLQQCLTSVLKSLQNIEAEIIMVDNHSVDGSVQMVKEKFPPVQLIENKNNVGFSAANNQGIVKSKGEYVVLLNPDTVVEETTFCKVIEFMDTHPDAGALGVKMIDGKGHFLPESKRSLPTPEVAFYKIFGLSRVFPKSKKFGKYHLTFLDKNKTHEVEVLSGAFMMIRKDTLEKTGLLDDTFFMYGEDIDLSYRIMQAGYKNYYFSDTRIIHYKGESTKKNSINYVIVFYKAMAIFARKHFSKEHAGTFTLLINFAIYVRALLAITRRITEKLFLPFLDVLSAYVVIRLIAFFWSKYVQGAIYPDTSLYGVIPLCILTWQMATWFSGGYDKPYTLPSLFKGNIAGTILILLLYSMLSEDLRFSRGVILLSSAATFLTFSLLRYLFHYSQYKNFKLGSVSQKRIAIIGDEYEAERVKKVLKHSMSKLETIFIVSPEPETKNPQFLCGLNQLNEAIRINKIDEVIFCAQSLSMQNIITIMSDAGVQKAEYKIAPPESLYIIGSNSINTSGDLYTIDLNTINKVNNKRNKRSVDVICSIILTLLFPFLAFYIKKPLGLFFNIMYVIIGKKSWVGYYPHIDNIYLPKIKPGVLNPLSTKKGNGFTDKQIKATNIIYAKDYKLTNDLKIIRDGLKYIGNS